MSKETYTNVGKKYLANGHHKLDSFGDGKRHQNRCTRKEPFKQTYMNVRKEPFKQTYMNIRLFLYV